MVLGLSAPMTVSAEHHETTPQESIDKIEGTYAGTFLCSLGEMGMTLSLKDGGIFTPSDFAGNPCRSGLGKCNDNFAIAHKGKRKTSGVINFFPTVGNPTAPQGAFEVSGWVNYTSKRFNRMELEPGDWISQPDNFGSAAMTGTLINGTISGKPTAPGCHDLTLQKVLTASE